MLVRHKLLIVKHSVQAAKVEGKFVRQSGGRGQYGHVWIEFDQMKKAKALNLKTKLSVVLFRENTFQLFKQELKNQCKMVFLAGYPLIDIKAKLV